MSLTASKRTSKKLFCRAAGATDLGLVRSNNEDAFLITADERVAVIADGMGGAAKGEVASSMVIANFSEVFGKQDAVELLHTDEDVEAALSAAAAGSDVKIRAHASDNPECQGMGSTVVAFAFLQDLVHVLHVGDSRAYLWREGSLTALTKDHTFVVLLGLEGDQAKNHPLRNVLTKALGSKGRPDHKPVAPVNGDVFLLCSDGLTRMLSEKAIAALLAAATPDNLQQICNRLIDETRKAGAEDNVTVALAYICAAKRSFSLSFASLLRALRSRFD